VGNTPIICWSGNFSAGGSADVAGATAAGAPVRAGFALADAVVSPLDGDELVCAPPELCTIPVRGSGVEAARCGEVELAWASTELSAIADVISEEEPVDEADESVEDVGPVDDGRAADSGEELEAAEDELEDEVDESEDEVDESEDEVEELESVGSASATPGVFATAVPMPSATANMPTRPIYCAFTGIAIFLCYEVPYGDDNPSHPFSVVNRVIAVPVEMKAVRAIEKYLPKQYEQHDCD
jgi:hypothetical protein